jgi:cell wall-associated NlpC family hydrolase
MLRIDDLLGKPFQDGGRGPDSYDCWGLAVEVFRRYGMTLPDYQIGCHDTAAIFDRYNAEKQHRFWKEVTADPAVPAVPALIFMRFAAPVGNHVGVYIGQGRFIHARAKTRSCIERVDSPQWQKAIIGYYVPRCLDDE